MEGRGEAVGSWGWAEAAGRGGWAAGKCGWAAGRGCWAAGEGLEGWQGLEGDRGLVGEKFSGGGWVRGLVGDGG